MPLRWHSKYQKNKTNIKTIPLKTGNLYSKVLNFKKFSPASIYSNTGKTSDAKDVGDRFSLFQKIIALNRNIRLKICGENKTINLKRIVCINRKVNSKMTKN